MMKLRPLWLAATFLFLLPRLTSASVLYGIDYGSATTSNLYSVSNSTGAATLIANTGNALYDLASNSSATDFALYGVDNTQNAIDRIDPVTGMTTSAPIDGLNGVVGSAAFNALTNTFYVTTIGRPASTGDLTDALYSVNLVPNASGDYAATRIGATGVRNILALTFDVSGALFGVSDFSHFLVKLNTATGSATNVGALALRQVYGLSTDPDDGTVYAASSQTHALYKVNTVTAGNMLVGGYGSNVNISGLAFAATSAPVTSVPEPGTLVLLGFGVAILTVAHRRRA